MSPATIKTAEESALNSESRKHLVLVLGIACLGFLYIGWTFCGGFFALNFVVVVHLFLWSTARCRDYRAEGFNRADRGNTAELTNGTKIVQQILLFDTSFYLVSKPFDFTQWSKSAF